MATEDMYEYFQDDEDYEYYDDDEDNNNANTEDWYYDEEEDEMIAPPKNVLEMISKQYSQQLLISPGDLDDDDEDHKQSKENDPFYAKEARTHQSPQMLGIDGFGATRNRSRSRNRSRHKKSNLKTKSKQSPNMNAINVIKGLFKHQSLSELPDPLDPESLEDLSPILENIINNNTNNVPQFIINLFNTSINNMFGTLNIDFNLLNNDYLYIKSVIVDGSESNNSSIKFERIMRLITNAKIDTLQISNVHLTADSFDCIINYLANDDNYDQENYLQNSVNTMILHRKSGLKYDKIESIYAEQFKVCGWKMSYDKDKQHIVITLNFTASWEYLYDEDYDEEEDEKNNNIPGPPSVNNIPGPPSGPPPSSNASNSVPPPPSGPPPSDPPSNSIPPPPSHQPPPKTTTTTEDEYEYYYEDDTQTLGQSDTKPPSNSIPTTTTLAVQEEEEYEYYYENEDGTTTMATGQTPMGGSTAKTPSKTPSIMSMASPVIGGTHKKTSTLMDIESGVGGIGGLLGLPPPDSSGDDEDDNGVIDGGSGDKSDRNKVQFLTEVLTKKDYDGAVLFKGMLLEIIHCMQRMDVSKGQCIMKETEYGQNYDLKFFVIEYGVFDLYQQGKKLGIELFSTSTFGETHILYGIPQYVTIRAVTNKCLVWYLNRSTYYQISWKYFHRPFKNRIKTQLNEFDIVCTLGIGSFGRVELVRDPNNKKTYSLKKLSKNNIIDNRQQQHIMNERSVMALISRTSPSGSPTSPKGGRAPKKSMFKQSTFCCKLYGLYQDKYYLYFLMEPLLGGELFTLLRHNKKFSEKVARFYLACIIVAFDHLHTNNIIYRDIKPENIMLASNGYVKLVDFGLSKLRNNSVTCCGTPEYLAPEIIQNYWQGFEVDFWGLGILLFEMIAGYPPFQSYEQILGSNVPIPQNDNPNKPFSKEVLNLINHLLIKHPYQRLGTTANKRQGIQEIYSHSWFKDKMEWNALKAQKFRPPYIPDIENDEDVSNFEDVESDDEETIQKAQNLYDDKSLYQWCQYF